MIEGATEVECGYDALATEMPAWDRENISSAFAHANFGVPPPAWVNVQARPMEWTWEDCGILVREHIIRAALFTVAAAPHAISACAILSDPIPMVIARCQQNWLSELWKCWRLSTEP